MDIICQRKTDKLKIRYFAGSRIFSKNSKEILKNKKYRRNNIFKSKIIFEVIELSLRLRKNLTTSDQFSVLIEFEISYRNIEKLSKI